MNQIICMIPECFFLDNIRLNKKIWLTFLSEIFYLCYVHFKDEIKFVAYNSRCTSIAWVPGGDGSFVVAHADGNLYVYEKASADFRKKFLHLNFYLPNFV